MMSYNVSAIVTGIGAIVVLIGGLLGFIGFPKIVEDQIRENLRMKDGSESYETWKDIQIPAVYKFYFFNVSNPLDVQNGAKPIVKEIGPYIYNHYRKKNDVTRTDDILSYYQYEHFKFNEEASAPLTQTDEITIVNLPLMSAALSAEEYTGGFAIGLEAVDSFIPTIFDNPSSVFLTTTPKDFLFDGVYLMCNSSGFVDSLACDIIESLTGTLIPRLEDGRFRFSLTGHRNDTRGDYLSINSGTKDINKLGETVAWGNFSTLNTWPENGMCNKVSGSGGTFPPFSTQSSELTLYSIEMCRSVGVKYDQPVTISGIEANRYLMDENTFASPSNYSDNQCYCLNRTKGITGDDGCLLDGAIEMWGCIGAPVVISWPHFHNANEAYRNGVIGMRPNKSLHTTFVDLEPMTGLILRADRRVQINIFIRPINGISLTTNLPTALMPVLWLDEHFLLTDEYIDQLQTNLFGILDILSAVTWCLLIFGSIIFTFGFVWLLKSVWGPPAFMKLPLNELH